MNNSIRFEGSSDGTLKKGAWALVPTAVAGLAASFMPLLSHGQVGERSGKDVVDAVCVECHRHGVQGAPKIGDRDAWVPRMKEGIDSLVRSAIRGYGGMPPRGTQANLTDGEVRSAVLYMFNPGASTAAVARAGSGTPAGAAQGSRDASQMTVGDIRIFLGFMPAESLRAFAQDSVERTMHGGVPRASGYYHLNVSLFDRSSNAPIKGAKVEARVEQPGLTGQTVTLEPVALGESSYGKYVRVRVRARHQVIIRVRAPNAPGPLEARFEHQF